MIGSPVTTTSLTPPTFDCSGVGALQNLADSQAVYIRYYASGQTTTGGWGFASSDTGVSGLIINGMLTATGAKTLPNEPQLITVAKGIELNIAPNPFNNDLTVNYEVSNNAPVQIHVIALNGSVVYSTTLSEQKGNLSLPLGGLAPGNYILYLTSGDSKAVRKIVKQ